VRKLAISLAAFALTVSVAVPVAAATSGATVTASLSPSTPVDTRQSQQFFANFTTSGLRPTVFTVTLPASADRPTHVGVLSGPGCTAKVKTTVVRVAKRWTIGGLQACARDSTFAVVFTTSFTKAGSANISWIVSENLLSRNLTRTGQFSSISVTQPEPGPVAEARGEVYDWVSDLGSVRDGVPLLAGTGANAYRLTWTAPRAFDTGTDSNEALTVTFPLELPTYRGYDIGGTCDFGDVENLDTASGQLEDGRATVTFLGLKCARGQTLVLSLIGVGLKYIVDDPGAPAEGDNPATPPTGHYENRPLPAGPVTFETVLTGEHDVHGTTSVQAVDPTHSIQLDIGDRLAEDAYTRSVTVTVRKANGTVDEGFTGAVEFARARCGMPEWPYVDQFGNAQLQSNTHDVTNGTATFLITSPDLGQTFTSGGLGSEDPVEVTSPTSTDSWVARLSDGTARMKAQQIQLGPEGEDQIAMGNGYECPTRGIF
jgi:hypothetical protein